MSLIGESLFSSEIIIEELKALGEKVTDMSKPQYDNLIFRSGGLVVGDRRYDALSLVLQTNNVYTSPKTGIPLLQAGEYVKILDLPNQIQVSSSSIQDSATVGTHATAVEVVGLDLNYLPAQELLLLNGHSPVTSTTSFISVVFLRVINSNNTTVNGGPNAGDLYVSEIGDPTTVGIPNSRADIMATMMVGDGVGISGVLTIPPGQELLIDTFTFSAAPANQITNLFMNIRTRIVNPITGVNESGWYDLSRINFTSNENGVIDLTGAPNLAFDPTKRTDIMMTIMRNSAGQDSVKVDGILKAHRISAIP